MGLTSVSMGSEMLGAASQQQEKMPAGAAGRFRRLEVALEREERVLSGEDEPVASSRGSLIDERA